MKPLPDKDKLACRAGMKKGFIAMLSLLGVFFVMSGGKGRYLHSPGAIVVFYAAILLHLTVLVFFVCKYLPSIQLPVSAFLLGVSVGLGSAVSWFLVACMMGIRFTRIGWLEALEAVLTAALTMAALVLPNGVITIVVWYCIRIVQRFKNPGSRS